MSKPLFEGSITNVHGIRVGQAENREALTGVTVVLCGRDGAVIGADVRGAAPGTREIALTRSENTVERANAVMLGGGGAFGLDAAAGVMRFLEEAGVAPRAPPRCSGRQGWSTASSSPSTPSCSR